MVNGNAKRPRISVVVPHLNQRDYLVHCLESLEAQTYPADRFEIIVVDNGSRVEPRDVVDRFNGARMDREAVPGPGPARNKGVSVATGAVLAFIDADCTADPGWLGAIADFFADDGPKRIAGGDVRIPFRDSARPTMLEAYESVFAYRQREYIECLGFSGTGNLAVRRADFAAIGPFGGIDVAEDREWGKRAGACGFEVRYVPGMIVYHPARTRFAEIFDKWERHIRHDFSERRQGGIGLFLWIARALAIGFSPVADVRRIAASDRINGARSRMLAFVALVRIRCFRAIRMLRLAVDRRYAKQGVVWNR